MPVTPTYPGVYIEEIPSGVRTIAGVSTSITAFVGAFSRGPANVAVPLFSLGDFQRELGGLSAVDETGYAIQQFFLNGGSTAWAVRVTADDDQGDPAAAAELTPVDAEGSEALRVYAGRQVRGRSMEDPGEWGDQLHLEVDYVTRDPADPDLFNLTVSEIASVDGRRVVLRTETFANCSVDATSSDYAVSKINAGSKMIQVELLAEPDDPTDAFGRPVQTGTTGSTVGESVTFDESTAVTVSYGEGDDEVTATATLTQLTEETAFGSGALVRSALEEAIRTAGREEGDPYLSGATVTVRDGALHVAAGGRTSADFDPETILEIGGDSAAALGFADATANVAQYRLGSSLDTTFQKDGGGGADGGPPDADALRGSASRKTGMYALLDIDLFNILALPHAAALGDNDAYAVYAEAEALCEAERAFLIVDVPSQIDEWQEAIDWVEPVRHRNAAVYFPRVRIPDPLDDNRLRSVGASGTMAGVFARTDGTRGVWKAPAGLEATLRNVQDLDVPLNDAENGQLNPVAVNALRRFPIYGRVAWGARTLEGADARASEWKYVPVRRLALYLEESLYRGMQWAVFEPNDHGLWAQIRLNVGAFMHNLFRQGAFQGTSPSDAYFVKCDEETTTQNDVDRGIVNVVVGFAPLKPAEFVIIQIQQMAGEIQT